MTISGIHSIAAWTHAASVQQDENRAYFRESWGDRLIKLSIYLQHYGLYL